MGRFAHSLLLLLVSFLIFSNLGYAQGSDNEPAESVCQGVGPAEEGCPLHGNGDFYGMGVRVGIYFQWITSWLANNFLPEEIIGSLDTNSIFLLALFSTVFTYSLQGTSIRVVDVLLIHQLCTGFLFSVMSLWGYRTMYYKTEGPGGRRHFGGFGTHFRLVLMSAITAYGVWFWIRGVDTLATCDSRKDCGGLETFFFVPLKVNFKVTRSINLVTAVGAAVYYGAMAITAIVAGMVATVRKLRGKEIYWELVVRPDRDVALNRRELTVWYIFLSCFNLFWLVFAIASIEVTLNLNHIQNVLGAGGTRGAGQVIPALIGLISFFRVLYELACQHVPWLKKKQEEDAPDVYDLASPTEHKDTNGLGLTHGAYSSALQNDDPAQTAGVSATLNRPPTILYPLHRTTDTHGRPRQNRRSLSHRILLAWLPWLNMFQWARQSLTPDLIRNSALFSSSTTAGHGREREKNNNAGFEVLGVKRMSFSTRDRDRDRDRDADARQYRLGHVRAQSSTTTTTMDEGPTTALLAPSPSQRSHSAGASQSQGQGQGQTQTQSQSLGLTTEMTDQLDIELSTRQRQWQWQQQWQSRGHRRMSSESTADVGMGIGTSIGTSIGDYEGSGYGDDYAA
ncbi:hypothetical protein G647_00873 [Cladophialophora carrionii CBS 160.54]|uniref:Uncharacterized protein n=1 Tax=Cladophialophora carrionii CBS 160.54 TaxID=1279043 RepID=V9DNF9_9EURO|nr:uncharacterized protein G647_00873 [Cladophialophora carrionii CBS 160.54]ETI28424.1 hypothetical protein G647_00873 [Cladophialophora carrionii CBS 160.54]